MRKILILACLAAVLWPALAPAQEVAPTPAPRIARPGDPAPAAPALPASGGETIDETPATPLITPGTQQGATGADAPQPVTLSARIAEDGTMIPSGLVWRIFDTRTDDTGQLILLSKSDEPNPVFGLIPGEYVIHLAYGRAQTTDTLTVTPGPQHKTLIIDVGALRLRAAVTGDIAVPDSLVQFDLYSRDDTNQRDPLGLGIKPGEIVYLNAGLYHVLSRFGSINATMRADLRVEPGQITDAVLHHKAAQISLRLVSEKGGEAIADVDWIVKDNEGETVFSTIGAFPELVLAEGDYLVLAQRGEQVYNRDFQVLAGRLQEIEVLITVY